MVRQNREEIVKKGKQLFRKVTSLTLVLCFSTSAISLLSGSDLVLAHDQQSVVTYQDIIIEKSNKTIVAGNDSTLKSSDETHSSILEVKSMIKETDDLINTANKMLDKQKRTQYKYENIPLSSSLKNEIFEACDTYNVDPDIMFGIYYVESRFNTKAANPHSSARGLGQIIKGTAKFCYKQVYKSSNYSHDLAFNPSINIRLTTYLVSYLYQRSGSITTAVQNYNGGDYKVSYAKKVFSYSNSLKQRERNYDSQ